MKTICNCKNPIPQATMSYICQTCYGVLKEYAFTSVIVVVSTDGTFDATVPFSADETLEDVCKKALKQTGHQIRKFRYCIIGSSFDDKANAIKKDFFIRLKDNEWQVLPHNYADTPPTGVVHTSLKGTETLKKHRWYIKLPEQCKKEIEEAFDISSKNKPAPSDEDNEALRDRYQDETELSVWSEEIYNDVGFSDKYVKWLENKVLINSPLPSDEDADELRSLMVKVNYGQATHNEMERADELTRVKWMRDYQPQTKPLPSNEEIENEFSNRVYPINEFADDSKKVIFFKAAKWMRDNYQHNQPDPEYLLLNFLNWEDGLNGKINDEKQNRKYIKEFLKLNK